MPPVHATTAASPAARCRCRGRFSALKLSRRGRQCRGGRGGQQHNRRTLIELGEQLVGQPHAAELLGLGVQDERVERRLALLLTVLDGHTHTFGRGCLGPGHQRQPLGRSAPDAVDDLLTHGGVVGEDEELEAGGSSLVSHGGSFVDGCGQRCFRGQCNHTEAIYPSSSPHV